MFKKLTALFLCAVIAFSIVACGNGEEEEKEMDIETFAKYTDVEIFRDIPAMDMEKYSVVGADDYGDYWDVMELRGTVLLTYAELESYVKTLESAGFKKYADNGKTGIDNAMFAATLTRENTVVALTFIASTRTVYIAAAENKPVSPHLLQDAADVTGNIPGAKTTLTMHALYETGNCYILQLKNGHYIINDGGFRENTRMLVDYLVENAPDGQKPVIDAWFISHDHVDHVGSLRDIAPYAYELAIEGIYCNTVSDDVIRLVNMTGDSFLGAAQRAALSCENSAGEPTPVYRMHAGERYYFNDITVEVLYTCEQIKESEYTGDLNASCTWLMYYIEGQKFLLNGDAELANMQHVSNYFDASFFDVDLMSVSHHGYNLYTDNPGYYRAKTLLYANAYFFNNGWWPSERKAANLALQEYCEEMIAWTDGSKRLTFPYTVGSVETIPCWYPEYVSEWCENQQKWAADIGIDWKPAEITN